MKGLYDEDGIDGPFDRRVRRLFSVGKTIPNSRCCMCKSPLWLVWRGDEILPTCLQCERDRPTRRPARRKDR